VLGEVALRSTELRFFLLTLPAGADAVTRRLFDGSGQLVSESDDVGGPAPAGRRGRCAAWPSPAAARL
jgi:hypothetical protein